MKPIKPCYLEVLSGRLSSPWNPWTWDQATYPPTDAHYQTALILSIPMDRGEKYFSLYCIIAAM